MYLQFYNHEQNIEDKFKKLNQTGFSYNVLQKIFDIFLAQLSKFRYWLASFGLAIPSFS